MINNQNKQCHLPQEQSRQGTQKRQINTSQKGKLNETILNDDIYDIFGLKCMPYLHKTATVPDHACNHLNNFERSCFSCNLHLFL